MDGIGPVTAAITPQIISRICLLVQARGYCPRHNAHGQKHITNVTGNTARLICGVQTAKIGADDDEIHYESESGDGKKHVRRPEGRMVGPW